MAQWKKQIITEEFAAEIEQTNRGGYATVQDAGSPFDGVKVFGSTAEVALSLLVRKIETLKSETVSQ